MFLYCWTSLFLVFVWFICQEKFALFSTFWCSGQQFLLFKIKFCSLPVDYTSTHCCQQTIFLLYSQFLLFLQAFFFSFILPFSRHRRQTRKESFDSTTSSEGPTELIRTRTLESVHLKFNLEAGLLLPLALRYVSQLYFFVSYFSFWSARVLWFYVWLGAYWQGYTRSGTVCPVERDWFEGMNEDM